MVSRFFLLRYTLFWALALGAIAFVTLCFDVGAFASVEQLATDRRTAQYMVEKQLPRHAWRIIDQEIGFETVYKKAFHKVCPAGNAFYRAGSWARLHIRFSRRAVYTWYLNQLAYQDAHLMGIYSISKHLFKKEPADLTPEELKKLLILAQ